MTIVQSLQKGAIESLQSLYKQEFTEKDFQVSQTLKVIILSYYFHW
jgi:hypothetical protein